MTGAGPGAGPGTATVGGRLDRTRAGRLAELVPGPAGTQVLGLVVITAAVLHGGVGGGEVLEPGRQPGRVLLAVPVRAHPHFRSITISQFLLF